MNPSTPTTRPATSEPFLSSCSADPADLGGMRRTIRRLAWTLALFLAPLFILYIASYFVTFTRMSLTNPTSITLHSGRLRFSRLHTSVPWMATVPPPGWHVTGSPQGMTFRGRGSAMFGQKTYTFRAEYVL